MLVMWTTENLTNSVGELVGSEQPLWLDDLALAMYPLGLDGVQANRTPFWQKAA